MATREKVILEAEDRASREFDKATGSFDRMSGTMKKLALSGGIAIAAAKLGQLGGQVVGLAIDAEEAESAFETAFGSALPRASAFVDEFAGKAGFARHELQQMLAVTGSVIQGIGATEEESAQLAESMATLAGDVASFSNAAGGSTAVLGALQSAINGEREALKTYGLALSETEVQQRALNETGKEHADELTRLEKAQATVALAYEKANKAVGDLDRTQDSAANTLRRLQGRAKDAGVEVGRELLPALEDLLPVVEDLIPVAADFGKALAGAFGGIAEAAGPALTAVGVFATGASTVVASAEGKIVASALAIRIALTAIAKHPLIVGGIAVIAGIGAIRQHVETLHEPIVAAKNAFDELDEAGRLRVLDQVFTAEQQARLAQFGISLTDIAAGTTELEDVVARTGLHIGETWAQIAAIVADEARPAFSRLGGEMGQIPALAAAAAGGVDELTAALQGEMPEAAAAILDLVPAAEEAAAAFRDDLREEAEGFITGFEKLPDRLKTTMNEFDKNLTDRIAAQEAFWSNLVILAEAGLGHLAESIRQQGPEAAGLLQEAVDDMEEAAKLDDIIRAGGEQMGDLTDEYATALERHSSPVLTALGQFGLDMSDRIADGIEAGNIGTRLANYLRREISRVTGADIPGLVPTGGPPQPRGAGPYQEGTWAVPGRGPVTAVVHGQETIFGPPGTSGRAAMVRELATELGRTLGGTGDGKRVSVTIEQVTVLVPAGTTISEAITAAGAEAAIEAILS